VDLLSHLERLTMIIESGIIVFVGMLLLFIKLPLRTSLWLLGKPLGHARQDTERRHAAVEDVIAWTEHDDVTGGELEDDGNGLRTLCDVMKFHYFAPRLGA
jgi:hypothetical protein